MVATAPKVHPVVSMAPAGRVAGRAHGKESLTEDDIWWTGPWAESKLKGVVLRIWPLNPTANGRNFGADLAKMAPAAETAKQGFSAVTRKTGLSKGTN